MNSIPEQYFNPQYTKNKSKQLSSLLNQPQYLYIKQSVDFIKKYMHRDMFQELFLSFNGGKDATVVLYLTLIAMLDTEVENKSIKCIYFAQPHPFEEVDRFIENVRSKISIEWYELPTKKYQEQLKKFSQMKKMKYIIMGSRKDDPYCQNLGMASQSDVHKGYPPFTRINPIIFWNYEQVWTFIKSFQIPYCSLYDEGYTYLGNKTNTTKNKTLFDERSNSFKKAHEAESQAQRQSRLHHQ